MNFTKNIGGKFRLEFYIFNLIIPAFFIGCALTFLPIDQVFYFDTDEGIELAKASLFQQNLLLSQDFWDPQPLLFNILLGTYLNLVGLSIVKARLFTLFFGTLIIWCLTQILRVSVGNIPTVIAMFLLTFSINFLRLSVSVMQGIPCLALAILALYFIILFEQKLQLYLLILAGISLGVSLQLKMITIFFVPVIILFLWIVIAEKKEKIIKISTFLISLGLCFIIIGLFTSSLDLQNILLFHLDGNTKDNYSAHNSLKDVILIYLQNFDFLLLTILGIPEIQKSSKQKNYLYLLPLFWLVVITILLINYRPIWYHYLLLVSVPLLWLGSYGIKYIWAFLKQSNFNFLSLKKQKIMGVIIIFILLVTPVKWGAIAWENRLFLRESQSKFIHVTRINKYKDHNNWLFTDVAMYGFYSQVKIPPEIAVLPEKRVKSGNINQETLLKVLEAYQPEQILIERFPLIIEEIKPYLQENYQKIYEDNQTKHYILKK